MSDSSKIIFVPTSEMKSQWDIEKYGVNQEFSKFVGVRYNPIDDKGTKHRIFIHYPRSLELESMDLNSSKTRIIIKRLLESIKLSKNTKEETNTYNNSNKTSFDEVSFPLYSYLWIWEDFKKNGRILTSDYKDVLNGSGKINWEKVFAGNALSDGNDIYYVDMVCKQKIITENTLTEIYDYCVYQALEMILFITNLQFNIIHPIHKVLNKGLKKQYVQIVNEALENTFDDEKKIRFINMKRILFGQLPEEINKKIAYGVDKYHGVFEKMIDKMLGNADVKDFYPAAYYKNSGKLSEVDDDGIVSKLRPDTVNVSKNDNVLFIFDSKFYESGKMPPADSVEKQIVYAEFANLRRNFDSDKIYNVFLLPPSSDVEFQDDDIKFKYDQYLYSDWKSNKNKYEVILVYRLNFKYVLKHYKSYNAELFEEIKKDVINRFENGTLLNEVQKDIKWNQI